MSAPIQALVLPYYCFLVQTEFVGPNYLKTVVSRMKYTIPLENLIEVINDARNFLNYVKNRYYKIAEYMAEWT